jgi:Holliday junction resolvasome RuvABC endonuclease subunit
VFLTSNDIALLLDVKLTIRFNLTMPKQNARNFKKKVQGGSVTKNQIKNMIKSAINVEKQVKHTYFEQAINATTTPVLEVPINFPAQGIAAYNTDESESSQGQRIGNKIHIDFWKFNMTVYDSTAGTESVFRYIIFQWLVPTDIAGEVPVIGDILAIGSSSYFYNVALNYDNRSKYHIIKDECVTLVTGSNTQVRHWTHSFTPKNFAVKELKFIGDSQSGLTASMIKGNIYIFFMSDGAFEVPLIEYSSYFGYTD